MSKRIFIVAPIGREQLEIEAQNQLREFQPECLVKPTAVDAETFFECELPKIANVFADYREIPDGIFGWSDSERMEVIVSIDLIESDSLVDRRRGRATIPHECYHAIKHIPQYRRKQQLLKSINNGKDLLFRQEYRQEEIKPYYNPEWQSWWWAKAFMMPLHIVQQLFNQGYTAYDMAEIFDLNPAFVKIRIEDLKRWGKI